MKPFRKRDGPIELWRIMLKWGGITARKRVRLGWESGGWAVPATHPTVSDNWVEIGIDSEVDIIGGPLAEEFRPGGKPEHWGFFHPKRFGSVDLLRETSQETTNRLTITQESYDAKIHYAETARRIDILMNSLITWGGREIYSRSWRRWMAGRKGQNPPCAVKQPRRMKGGIC